MIKKNSATDNEWLPDYYAGTVQDIDFDYLTNKGIKVMMFDLDHTILTHGSSKVEADTVEILSKSGMDIYIATNRRKSHSLDGIKDSISAKGIMFARSIKIAKPSRKYYDLAIEMTGNKTDEVAMVGDRLVQDIFGANKAGITTIMVSKLGRIRWYDQILTVTDRIIPKLFKRHYEKID